MNESPFGKFQRARVDAQVTSEAVGRGEAPGPKGKNGPLVDRMISIYKTLGKETLDSDVQTPESELDERLFSLRRSFIEKQKRRARRIYETLEELREIDPEDFNKEYGSLPTFESKDPAQHTFLTKLTDSFEEGFELFLKVMFRYDMQFAPKPYETFVRTVHVYGKGQRPIKDVDPNPQDAYNLAYLQQGNNLDTAQEPLNLDVKQQNKQIEQGNGLRESDFIGYSKKYKGVGTEEGLVNDEEQALRAYMFEKLWIFSSRFFDMFEQSINAGVNIDQSILVSKKIYGFDETFYDEMGEQGIDPQTIANLALKYPESVRRRAEAYIQHSPSLEQTYPPRDSRNPWIRSKNTIKNLTFEFPDTVVNGLATLAETSEENKTKMAQIMSQYPGLSQETIMRVVVANPDEYQKVFTEAQEKAGLLSIQINTGNESLFGKDNMLGALMGFVLNNPRLKEQELSERLTKAVGQFSTAISKAKKRGVEFNEHDKRRVLRGILRNGQARVDRIINRLERARRAQEKKNAQIEKRAVAAYERMFISAEKKVKVNMQLKDFTELIVDVGFGSSIDWTEEDYVENGFTLVDLYVKQFGPDDAEDILMTLVYRVGDYLEAFEETDEETIHFLRDAVFSCPDGGVREFYETIRDGKGKAWPDGLEEQAGVL